MELNKIYQGDSLQVLSTFPSESIDCIITSPPYYGLRDYGVERQLGQETTPQLYIQHLMAIMNECKRVLKKSGSLWVNIGDSYASQGGLSKPEHLAKANVGATKAGVQRGIRHSTHIKNLGVREKSLLAIPERFVIAMTDSDWIRRNTVIWHKPNCMPSSAKDRFTVDFEYFYFFTKSKKYYFESQYEDFSPLNIKRHGEKQYLSKKEKLIIEMGIRGGYAKMGDWKPNPLGRMKRCVWKINTQPFPEAHFAVFPETLIETPIKACCPLEICDKCNKPRVRMEKILGYDKVNDWMISGGCDSNGEYKGTEIKDYKSAKAQMPSETKRRILKSMSKQTSFEYSKCDCNVGFHKGVILDPFMGAGTVGVVAKKLGVDYIGIELNKDYIKMAENRINNIL